MTGLELIKDAYWILKFIGYPLFAILFGFDYKQYSIYFDNNIDDVLMVTVGSGIAITESVKQFTDTVNIEMSISAMVIGTILVVVKSIVGVCVTAVMTWTLKILSPYITKRSEPLKKWLKKTFK